MKALDTVEAKFVASHTAAFKEAGVLAVGLYYFKASQFKDLLTHEVAKKISSAGLKIFSVYENGFPTQVSYFTHDKANMDAHTAAVRSADAQQPSGTPIYFAVDYDAELADLPAITTYFTEVRRVFDVLENGHTLGVYSSGRVCKHLLGEGLVTHTWLCQSTGFADFTSFKPQANIVQQMPKILLGQDVDPDVLQHDPGTWQLH